MIRRALPVNRSTGILLALATAGISGAAIYLNGIAVATARSGIGFTTGKDLIAAVVLTGILIGGGRSEMRPALRRATRRDWLGLAFIGVVGGGLAFGLFFEGLSAGHGSTQAAFLQKTLVVWVALMAPLWLAERVTWRHIAAIAMLVVGQLLLGGAVSPRAPGRAEAMILAATLLWAVEVVVARRLLPRIPGRVVGALRMVVGTAVLLVWLVLTHHAGDLAMAGRAWMWALVTGVILAAYITTWLAALRRAPAVDVTAVLVAGAFVTALLGARGGHVAVWAQGAGVMLIGAGVVAVMTASAGRRRPVMAA